MSLILQQFLSKHNHSNLQNEFNDNYESHPNFPSLFALTDTYTLLGIENVAANVPKDQLDQLPNCFLAYVKNGDRGLDMVLVEQTESKIIIVYDDQKKQYVSTESFKELWNGVIVAISLNENKEKKKSSLKKGIIVALIVLGLFFLNIGFDFLNETTISFVFYTIGFLISVFIVQEKLDKAYQSVSNYCTFNKDTSCNSIIKSEDSKITKWLNFSDLPILFFSISIVAMLIDSNSYLILNLLSLLSIPIVIYSVWLQKMKLKKWCVLCLAISTVLLLQATLLIKSGFKFHNSSKGLVVAVILTTVLWFFIKKILEKNVHLEKDNKQLKKFKRNYNFFKLLQKPLKTPTRAAIFSTVEIGSRLNPVKVSLVLSPSCGHCHTAFEQAINLFKSNSEKIQLSIFFNLNIENKDNPYLEVAKNILQINQNDPQHVVEALSDWHIKKMSLSDWLFKWEQLNIDADILEDLQLQYEWCLQNDFNYTPVKMINENEFPREYNFDELKYFISDIEDTLKPLVFV